MNRRDWLRRAAWIAGGVLAADQIELIEKLTPKRYVQGWTPRQLSIRLDHWYEVPFTLTDSDVDAALRRLSREPAMWFPTLYS